MLKVPGVAVLRKRLAIPIVFAIGADPIAPGLVTNLSRPGGNITGVSFYSAPLVTKRLDLARVASAISRA